MKLRNDVILEKVDGIYVLVALRSAWKECPFAMQTIPSVAYIWNRMQNNCDKETILSELVTVRGLSEEKAKRVFEKFMESARKLHYLVDQESIE